jgi:hypothetical protein
MGTGSPGSGPATGSGGVIGSGFGGTGNIAVTGGTGGFGGACQQHEVVFVPQIPTVYILVDRSWTMFDVDPATQQDAWAPLRTGVLQVISELQAEVRFGFAAFTGHNGGMCPVYDHVAAALSNHDAIAAVYNGLAKTTDKGETPTTMALRAARDALLGDTTPGGKYVLFVTDGEPDFCTDDNPLCPVDSVTQTIQAMYGQGIGTFIFGLTTTANQVSPGGLQAWANAGVGQPSAIFGRNQDNPTPVDPVTLFYECQGVPGWAAEAAMLGGRTQTSMPPTLATYSPTGGTAPVYQPNLANQMELTQQLRTVIAGVKSCSFDLQGSIEVNVNRAGEGMVLVQDVPVPYDPTGVNGWRMASPTVVELVGPACTDWQTPEKTKINFGFPCEIIVVVQ